MNRIKVLTATLQPNDLVQFGGAAGLKAGDTLAALPPSTADAGNAIVYRFVVRPKEQLQGQGLEGAGSGRKRPAAATNWHAGVPAPIDGGDGAAASTDAKRRRMVQEEGAQGEGNGGAKGATTRLEEEVKELRGALAGATQGAEAIFKVCVRVCVAPSISVSELCSMFVYNQLRLITNVPNTCRP